MRAKRRHPLAAGTVGEDIQLVVGHGRDEGGKAVGGGAKLMGAGGGAWLEEAGVVTIRLPVVREH